MSMIHLYAETIRRTHTGYEVSGWVVVAVPGGVLLLTHLVRALRTDERAAGLWLQRRGLSRDPRSVGATVQYLHRLRWSRVGTTVLLLASTLLAARFLRGWISFVSLPFLLSVLAAETLAPAPRRGRLRTALLQRRSRSFFAPRLPLLAARVTIAAGLALSLLAVLNGSRATAVAALHGTVLLVGGCALEACLRATSLRAIPDREPDLSLDTAMRVTSARTATAAALIFGTFGLILADGYADFGPDARSPFYAGWVMSLVVNVGFFAAIITGIVLLQPLSSWRPRESS